MNIDKYDIYIQIDRERERERERESCEGRRRKNLRIPRERNVREGTEEESFHSKGERERGGQTSAFQERESRK